MQRFLHIGLLLLVLNAATELHQLFKLPALLEHYRHHHRENPAMSFVDFMRLHYNPHHPKDGDSQEDNQLPFRSVGTLAHIELNWIPALPDPLMARPAVANAYPEKAAEQVVRRTFGIFHPPRLA